MSKGKTWQRVASAFLAAVMTFSTFSTTIAYAAEATTDSSITTDAVSDTNAAEEVDATDPITGRVLATRDTMSRFSTLDLMTMIGRMSKLRPHLAALIR